jgi:hypothetical protein
MVATTDDLLTMRQAAEALALNRTAVYRAFPQERRVHIAGKPFLRRADVEAYRRDPARPGRPPHPTPAKSPETRPRTP